MLYYVIYYIIVKVDKKSKRHNKENIFQKIDGFIQGSLGFEIDRDFKEIDRVFYETYFDEWKYLGNNFIF